MGSIPGTPKRLISENGMLKNKTFSVIVCFDVLCIILTVIFSQTEGAKTLFITFLTISYHFTMRLFVGVSVTVICKNRSFKKLKISKLEERLYRALKVKMWKKLIITAKPEQFDMKCNSMEVLLHNMAQAELVHKIIVILSFVPIAFIIPFGAPAAFIITSVISSMIDIKYVIIQRFNRQRLQKTMEKADYFRINLSRARSSS